MRTSLIAFKTSRFALGAILLAALPLSTATAQVGAMSTDQARAEQKQASVIYKTRIAEEKETLKNQLSLWTETKPDFSKFADLYGIPSSVDCDWEDSKTADAGMSKSCKIIWTQEFGAAARAEALTAFKTSPALWRTSMGAGYHTVNIIGQFQSTGKLITISSVFETSS